MENISDAELRTALSEFMKEVPPVTESTRHILLEKLKKCRNEKANSDHLENLESNAMNNFPVKSVQENPPMSSLNKATADEVKSSKTRQSIKSSPIKPNAPPQLKSSPVYEYVSRLPSYRRRSIHPNRPLIDDPYSDLEFSFDSMRSPRVTKKTTSTRRWSLKADNQIGFLINCSSAVVKFVKDTMVYVTGQIGTQRFSLRHTIYFVFLLTILILMAWFLLGDPFYHNPVKDLGSFIRLPNF